MAFYVLRVNPEPWVSPQFTCVRGRGSGKMVAVPQRNAQMYNYQQAIKEAIKDRTLISGKVRITFYFWRNLAQYSGRGKRVKKNEVDATNLQKATEDALHDVFFENDKEVSDIRSVIVAQGADVEGRIVIKIEPWDGFDEHELPPEIWSELDRQPNLFAGTDNAWPPRG